MSDPSLEEIEKLIRVMGRNPPCTQLLNIHQAAEFVGEWGFNVTPVNRWIEQRQLPVVYTEGIQYVYARELFWLLARYKFRLDGGVPPQQAMECAPLTQTELVDA